jgi:hypothetical protein
MVVVVLPESPFSTVDSDELAEEAVFARVIRMVPWSPGRRTAGVTWYEVMATVGSVVAADTAEGSATTRRRRPSQRASPPWAFMV